MLSELRRAHTLPDVQVDDEGAQLIPQGGLSVDIGRETGGKAILDSSCQTVLKGKRTWKEILQLPQLSQEAHPQRRCGTSHPPASGRAGKHWRGEPTHGLRELPRGRYQHSLGR